TMSLSIRPVRRLTSRSITRSQSFTGVNTHNKPYRNLVVFSTPGLSRKPSRASRLFTMSIKANPPPKVPQPERLDEVYEALKKGLQERDYECVCLCSQVLPAAFPLYSQIEEFYESYCMQRRLRDGANKMVKAYTASSGSKEAKESLAEASKGYKEYTENMCVLENDFENQLGKFHIKMKGLAGFARLCAGDQYEIFMKYGRQRWKLRGRIEINAKQVWDSEEIVFQPLINEFLSVKVTELKSLANHVVVGSVSCETKDLFAALPQMVAVDINDLGTIKLSLEVTWNPFDKDDQGSVASTVNKPPSINKRISAIFDQTPPDTPPLRVSLAFALDYYSSSCEGCCIANCNIGHFFYKCFVLFVFKCLGKFGPLRCGEMYALDRLLREARVLEIIRRVTKENPQKIRPATEGDLCLIPALGLCLGAVSLWQECVGQGSMYSVSAERFLNTLSTIYAGLLPERAEAVFLCLVERVLDQRLPRRGSSRDNMMVTLFQLWSYLDSNAVSDMDTHIIELAKEVWLVQNLTSSDQDVIVNALRRPAECSLRREGIHAVAKLLKDPRGKVSASASSVLRSLAAQPRQRKQALVSCLELLEDENVDNRVCGCKALACLKAKESIDQLVYLCRADKEEVRDAAKQTLLVLGEEGKMAHRHVETSQDSISRLFAPGSMASTAF
uniref:FAM65 N-terminal domain-containing protein n=1 Tax=Astatotilapia calliptera TaxID=8154 RepID=A0A3P8Q175_ASTCA